MEFRKPEVVENYLGAIWESSLALEKVLRGAPLSAAEHFPRIWNNIRGQLENNPENTAWTFLASCVSTALVMLLRQPRMHCDVTNDELADLAKGLVAELPDAGDIRESDLINLALAQCTQDCIQKASAAIIQAAIIQDVPKSDFEKEQPKQLYEEALARSVTVVFEKQPDLFSGLIESITGPTAEPEMREIAWQRHGAWCRGLFCEDQIFFPDNNIDIPLSHVYQDLRCFWNEEHEKKREGERDPLKYRTATVDKLHKTIGTWLSESKKGDTIRLITGGPGSGKSSFARAFATKLLGRNSHRVLFIQLQRFQWSGGTLREAIGKHLEAHYSAELVNKCEGFPKNPLTWHVHSNRPLLMIFDGLDELTTNISRAENLAANFVSHLKALLNELNDGKPRAAAFVLGRDVAMSAALEAGGLDLDNLIHVAPIRAMTRADLRLDKNPPDVEVAEDFDPVVDPRELIEVDTRKAYWDRWCRVQDKPESDPPQAILDDRMSELNAEPLLLHLLIISDFCGARWEEAADNRNLVYENIFSKVFERDKKKELEAYNGLKEKHFFELMEVVGLAVFRGNGRTGSHDEYNRLRDLYVFSEDDKSMYSRIDGAELKNVVLMIHSRKEVQGEGFEFIHKSFGEYLAARALLGVADRLSSLKDRGKPTPELAELWVSFVGTAELSNSVLSFLRDECRKWEPDEIEKALADLTAIFDNTLADGFPVHRADGLPDKKYRQMEHHQKCVEKAMLATITSLWLARANFKVDLGDFRSENNEGGEFPPPVRLNQFATSPGTASRMIDRLFSRSEMVSRIDPTLSGLNLKNNQLHRIYVPYAILIGAELTGANLFRADLSNAILVMANLTEANLTEANLTWADLTGANLYGANLGRADLTKANLTKANLTKANLTKADLTKADLTEADLKGVNLTEADLTQEQVNSFFGIKLGPGKTRLPGHLSYPDHWYNAENISEADGQVDFEEYMLACETWRLSR